ncbi:MAG: T9SS type A sorting domain-containing protein [Flavobacterium sp.]|nr:MAG: T9SS type A sorting domain-containing protein [Flavobacterium sp.]
MSYIYDSFKNAMFMKAKLLVKICLLLPTLAFSQAYTLDAGFGTGGYLTTAFADNNSFLSSLALQPDGKIITCGHYVNGALNVLVIARYNADGTPDTAFNGTGILTAAVGSDFPNDYNTVRLQQDGKIVVGGSASVSGTNYFFLARYNSNGTADAAFGDNGIIITNFAGRANTIEIQPDNKILIAGYVTSSANGDFGVARFNSDGTLDGDFGVNGLSVINIGTVSNPLALSGEKVKQLKLLPDGKILAAGTRYAAAADDIDFAIVRLNADGTLDSDFGTDGKTVTDFGANENLLSMEMSGEKILLMGTYSTNDDFQPVVVVSQYNIDGSPDTSYAVGGKFIFTYASASQFGLVTSSAIDASGKLIIGGILVNEDPDMMVIRLNANGTLDETLDTDGIFTQDLDGAEAALTLMFQPDGKLIAGGQRGYSATSSGFIVARFNTEALREDEFSIQTFSAGPNPFTSSLQIRLNMAFAEKLTAELIDANGRKIETLFKGRDFSYGPNVVNLAMPEMISHGVYYLKLMGAKTNKSIKLIK